MTASCRSISLQRLKLVKAGWAAQGDTCTLLFYVRSDADNDCAKTLFGTWLAWWMRPKPKSRTTLLGLSNVCTMENYLISQLRTTLCHDSIEKITPEPIDIQMLNDWKRKGSHFGLSMDPFASCGDDSAISSNFYPIHPRALQKLHSRTAIPWAFLSKPSDVISRCCTCILAFASITVTAALVVPLPGLSA